MNIFENNLNKEISGKQLNEYNVKFYKFINEEKCHNDLVFDVGEIIDPIKFNPTNSCSKGGIYFTTFEHIFRFLDYGCYFCEIIIFDDSRCYIENNKIKANKFTIKNMIPISDLNSWNNTQFCLEAVKQNGKTLRYVREKTEEIRLEAVKENGLVLEYIRDLEQTEQICLEAVKQIGLALQFVKEQTEQICIEAVKEDGMSIKHVKEQTEQICLEAVKQRGRVLCYVREKTEQICLEAIKQDGMALEFVRNLEQTEEMCLEAVKQDGYSLCYVEKQTKEICFEAVKQDKEYASCWVEKPFKHLFI
jgi:hypothetical protein